MKIENNVSIVVKKALKKRGVSFVIRSMKKREERIFCKIKNYNKLSCLVYFEFENPIKDPECFINKFIERFDTREKEEFKSNLCLTKNTFRVWDYKGENYTYISDLICIFFDHKYLSIDWEIIKIND